MTTAPQVLAVAAAQIGTREDASGSNPYGRAYGMDRVAWCAQFVWWAFREAGASGLIPKTAYTPTLASWYQQQGRASRTPQPGSLVFYNWPGDGVDRIQHVGLVERVVSGTQIQTIEGNTTSGAAGDQSHGGVVARRLRSTSAVVLYGHPAYDGAPVATPPALDGSSLATLSYGMRNDSRVAAFQRQSNAFPWAPELPVVPATGNYLDQTRDLVARIQAQVGITGPDANGSVIGPRTKAELARRSFRW